MKIKASKLTDGSIVLEIRGKSQQENAWLGQMDNRIKKQEKLADKIDSGFDSRDTVLTVKVPPPVFPEEDLT